MDRKLILVPVIFALAIKNAGDVCAPDFINDPTVYITNAWRADMFCRINSYKPEHPETRGVSIELPVYVADRITASGTASSLASTSLSQHI